MIPAIGWKQWREQRLPASILLMVGASYLIILRSTESPQHSKLDFMPYVTVVAALVSAAYGLIGGALLLAGDREERTQGFLEQLTPSRLSLWLAKALVGTAFTLLHSLLLGAILYGIWSDKLQPGDVLRQCWVIPLYALVAFGWGACASALAQTVPLALVIGGLPAIASVLVGSFLIRPALWSEPDRAELLGGVVVVGATLLASVLLHCWADIRRSLGDIGQRPFLTGPRYAASSRWLWLRWRQSWPILLLLILGFVVGWWLPTRAMLLWPVVTLAGGLIIGSALLERRQGWEFLQEQRLRGRTVWVPGTLAGLLVAACFGGLVLGGAVLRQPKVNESVSKKPPFLERAMGIREEWLAGSNERYALPGNTAVFLTLWLLAGFSVGRLGILSFARKAITVGVGLPVSVLLAGVWIPSILNQGLLWWQALMPCAVLLLGCVLVDWSQGALARRGKAILVASCLVVALAWVAGVLWHRATEIPDTKEPFDVAGFAATLVPPENDRVGRLVVRATKEYRLHMLRTTRKLGRPDTLPTPDRESADRIKELQHSNSAWDWAELYRLQLDEVDAKGWPDRATKLDQWVDGLFEGQWVQHLKALNDLPGSMCVVDWHSSINHYTFEFEGQPVTGHCFDGARDLAQLLHVRALQHQRRGQSHSALNCYRTILTLSRHLRERGETLSWLTGVALQRVACDGLEQWAYGVEGQGLLLQALQEVSEEEPSMPLVSLVCREYYSIAQRRLSDLAAPYTDRTDNRWTQRLSLLTRLAPWERERERRYLNRVYTGLLEGARLPSWEGESAWEGLIRVLPPHPVARLTPSLSLYRSAYCYGLCRLRGLRLQLALAIYQARHGRCPTRLDELAPELLRTIPADPWSGKPFGYRLSKGESLPVPFMGADNWRNRSPYYLFPVRDALRWFSLPGPPGTPSTTVVGPAVWIEPHRWVAPGRGIVWSVGEDRRDDGGKDEAVDKTFLVPYFIRPSRN
jgi:hypothetical protein